MWSALTIFFLSVAYIVTGVIWLWLNTPTARTQGLARRKPFWPFSKRSSSLPRGMKSCGLLGLVGLDRRRVSGTDWCCRTRVSVSLLFFCPGGKQRMKRNLVEETLTARHLSRRRLLGWMGAAVAAPLVGCARGQAGEVAAASPADTAAPSCVVRPQQTAGPYFVDEKLNRSDIRTDPTDGVVRQGLPLRVVMRVSQMTTGACAPLAGAIVDLWQCDAVGVYSDVRDEDGLFDTRGKKFLRGYQVTDATGKAEFLTIYPGWYPGRTVHIHFKIRTDFQSPRGHEFTSQL